MRTCLPVFLLASGCGGYLYQDPARDFLAMLDEPDAGRRAEMERKIDPASLREVRRLGTRWALCRVMADDRGLRSASVLASGDTCVAWDDPGSPTFHAVRRVHWWSVPGKSIQNGGGSR